MKVTAATLIILLLVGCWPTFKMDAQITELVRVSSPDGKAQVVIQHVSVGATAAPGYVIFLIPPGIDLKKESNRSLYVMGSFHASGGGERHEPRAVWLSEQKVSITCSDFLELYRNRESASLNGVTYHLDWKKEEPNQPVQPTPGTGSVSNLKSPARRG